jgi:hypothetical protein
MLMKAKKRVTLESIMRTSIVATLLALTVLGCCQESYAANEIAHSTTTLSQARSSLGATAVGNYALFAGGCDYSNSYKTVDIFNASTGQWSTASLSHEREYVAATSVGTYALFAGTPTGTSWATTVDIFDASNGRKGTYYFSGAFLGQDD